jgi:hypothetical protein
MWEVSVPEVRSGTPLSRLLGSRKIDMLRPWYRGAGNSVSINRRRKGRLESEGAWNHPPGTVVLESQHRELQPLGAADPRRAEPKTTAPGINEIGIAASGTSEPGSAEPRTAVQGAAEPGVAEPGVGAPGIAASGTGVFGPAG